MNGWNSKTLITFIIVTVHGVLEIYDFFMSELISSINEEQTDIFQGAC